MTAEELWKKSGFYGTYEAWPFGEAPDELADLVLQGRTLPVNARRQILFFAGERGRSDP